MSTLALLAAVVAAFFAGYEHGRTKQYIECTDERLIRLEDLLDRQTIPRCGHSPEVPIVTPQDETK